MVWARERNLRVNVWTVDEAAEAQRLVNLGVHGIITNKPGFIRNKLN
jgi:glycerophosphoryl diester phosphodiesterase